MIPNCNKEILNHVIEEVLNRDDLFESKKAEFQKKLKVFRESCIEYFVKVMIIL